MAGVTFTVGSQAFSALGTSAGRYALAIKVDAAKYDIKRFHVTGVDGTYKIRGGRMSRQIIVRMRYIGTVAAAVGYYTTDNSTWVNSEITITDDASTSIARCELHNMQKLTEPKATGLNSTDCYFDAEAIFISDY